MTSSVVDDDDLDQAPMQVLDLRNGHANGHAAAHLNGHANGHVNGHLNGHSNGHANGHAAARPREEFVLGEMASFLGAPLVGAGFAGGSVAAPALVPAIPVAPHAPSGLYANFGKRLIDVAGGLVSLVLAGPIVLLAAIAVLVTSRGPAFYKSTRLGKNGRPFTFYKLRSMYVGADAERARLMHLNEVDGPVFKLRRDPRVTRVGQWLRSTSIDELPQLLNVLRGDMSLVGPRPPLPEEADKYEAWQRCRLDVKPGITCLWQVSGRSRLSFEEWMRLDLEYIRRQSLATDLWILVRTIPAVLSREGAY
jgi:lipopolysaccharide/colanic/teichoic acid biosynthesis glycosyltransferase